MKIKKPFLIAEIGINHNGDIDVAKNLILMQKKQALIALSFKKEQLITFIQKISSIKKEKVLGDLLRESKKKVWSLIMINIKKLKNFV